MLAAALTFSGAAIGIASLWFALSTRSWDELEAVVVPPLILGVTLAAGWGCVLGIGLLGQSPWAKRWALLTFMVVSAFSGLALVYAAGRVLADGPTPVSHLVVPAGLFVVATSIVWLVGADRS